MSKLDDTDERRWVTAQLRTPTVRAAIEMCPNVAMGSSRGVYGVCISLSTCAIIVRGVLNLVCEQARRYGQTPMGNSPIAHAIEMRRN